MAHFSPLSSTSSAEEASDRLISLIFWISEGAGSSKWYLLECTVCPLSKPFQVFTPWVSKQARPQLIMMVRNRSHIPRLFWTISFSSALRSPPVSISVAVSPWITKGCSLVRIFSMMMSSPIYCKLSQSLLMLCLSEEDGVQSSINALNSAQVARELLGNRSSCQSNF